VKNKISVFLDSGAFSAWSKGVDIDIQDYITFIKENEDMIDVYANLDVISDVDQTWENQKIMEDAGLTPLPVYHCRSNEDIKYLHKCMEYPYFCLGGMAKGFSSGQRVEVLDRVWSVICKEGKSPKHKVHGFGMTAFRLMRRYPWYSVDSTSWIMTSRMGSIFIPRKENGEFVYDKDPFKIFISEKSPSKGVAGQHIETVSKGVREVFDEYIQMKGFNIEELSQEYIKRDLINLEFFKDFESHLPKWPWAFKRPAGIRSFF